MSVPSLRQGFRATADDPSVPALPCAALPWPRRQQESGHESNIGPWVRMAAARGCTLRTWKLDARKLRCPVRDLPQLLTPRTRIVALSHVSNLLGALPGRVCRGLPAGARAQQSLLTRLAVWLEVASVRQLRLCEGTGRPSCRDTCSASALSSLSYGDSLLHRLTASAGQPVSSSAVLLDTLLCYGILCMPSA